jgi:curved DNA-binding protein CbpA
MTSADYYTLLGVNRDATVDDIRSAYRRLARQYHPDLNRGTTKLGSRFQAIAQAYAVLGSPALRSKYDLTLSSSASPTGPNSGASRTSQQPSCRSDAAAPTAKPPSADTVGSKGSAVLCRNCKKANTVGGRYCDDCGAALPFAAPRSPAAARTDPLNTPLGSSPAWTSYQAPTAPSPPLTNYPTRSADSTASTRHAPVGSSTIIAEPSIERYLGVHQDGISLGTVQRADHRSNRLSLDGHANGRA